MQGNIRQRGAGSWELRVFAGRDPATGRKRYLTKTVRGGKRQAQRELVTLVYAAQQGAVSRSRSTVDDRLTHPAFGPATHPRARPPADILIAFIRVTVTRVNTK